MAECEIVREQPVRTNLLLVGTEAVTVLAGVRLYGGAEGAADRGGGLSTTPLAPARRPTRLEFL